MELNISKYIDYTLLKADACAESFEKLCEEAAKYGFYSVCVPPYMIKNCKSFLSGSGVKIATVVAFPLGYCESSVKAYEVGNALKAGADEVDAVINVSALKSGNISYVENELKEIRKAAGANVLKIIIETCYLTKEEIATASKIAAGAGADFVKTSTGYGASGARLSDITLIKNSVPSGVKIKASGEIKTFACAAEFIKAGASRIGTSALLLSENGESGQ